VSVIRKIKAHFARHGVPEQLVTNNGSQFTSCDFLGFVKEWDTHEQPTSQSRKQQGRECSEGNQGNSQKASAERVDQMHF